MEIFEALFALIDVASVLADVILFVCELAEAIVRDERPRM